jgi:hypothetical protein
MKDPIYTRLTSGERTTLADQIAGLGPPPKPLPLSVHIVDAQGRPTSDYARYMTTQYEWLKRLAVIVGGIP